MILQALVKHYEDLEKKGEISKRGWCQAKISYAINLDHTGEIKSVLSLKDEKTIGKKTVLTPVSMTVPEMVTRSSGISANFLCDNSKYILGIDKEGINKRVIECFMTAKEKHLQLLQNVSGEMAQAICAFFKNWNPENAHKNVVIEEKWEEITEGGNLIFCVGNNYAQDDTDIKDAWERTLDQVQDRTKRICLVTGKVDEISRIHKTIKGVPGAQSSGAALVSFNAPAFESYGKEQSYNAPVGRYAEFAYTTALNHLLAQRKYTFQLGDAMVIYWAEEAKTEYQDIFSAFINPQKDNQQVMQNVFEKLNKDEYFDIGDVKLNPKQNFYILGLAPNAARLSVRFFYHNSFGAILENLEKHYKRLEIVKPAWEARENLGISDMLQETVNQNSKDKNPVSNMAALVLTAILSDSRYPTSLYTDTLIRIRAEQGKVTEGSTWGRAAIIKAYLIKNYKWEDGESYMGINEECNETAYVLGRIFAVLEDIQKQANPGIKATIRDRYFNSACATPALVFPILMKLKNSHIKKIEREKEYLKNIYENRLGSILEKLDYFPKRLSLEEQGKFILGYYHQTQKKYEKQEEE